MKLKIILLSLLSYVVLVSWNAIADQDKHFWKKRPGIAPANNSSYQEECGSCHFATGAVLEYTIGAIG